MALAPSPIAGLDKAALWGPIEADDSVIVGAAAYSNEGNNGGGDTTIQSTQARPTFTNSFRGRINTNGTGNSGTRCELNPKHGSPSNQDPIRGWAEKYNLGHSFYFSAWYYIPSFINEGSASTVWFNIFQQKQEAYTNAEHTTGTRQLIWYVNLEVRQGTQYMPVMRTTVYENGNTWNDDATNPQYDRIIAASDVPMPTAQWVNLEAYVEPGTQGSRDGRVIMWMDGEELWNIPGFPVFVDYPTPTYRYDYDSGAQPVGALQMVNNHYRGNDQVADQDIFWDGATLATYRTGSTLTNGTHGTGPKAVGHFAAAEFSTVSTNGTGTFDYFCDATMDFLLVLVAVRDGTDNAVSTVTYGGNSATLLSDGVDSAADSFQSGDYQRTEIWGVKLSDLPAIGSYHDVVVTLGATADLLTVGAQGLRGANQSYTVHKVVQAGRSAVTDLGKGTITTSAGNLLIFDLVNVHLTNNQMWGGTNQATIGNWVVSAFGQSVGASWAREPSSGTFDMEWFNSGSTTSRLSHIIVAIAGA